MLFGRFKLICIGCSLSLLIILPLSEAASSKSGSGPAPPTPTLLSPSDGANVNEPFPIVWSAVNDSSGIIAYNWQISASPSFAPVLRLDSTGGQTTQDTISGLPFGTYYWRVQAVSGAFQQSAWSQLNVDGIINGGDTIIVRGRSGTFLP